MNAQNSAIEYAERRVFLDYIIRHHTFFPLKFSTGWVTIGHSDQELALARYGHPQFSMTPATPHASKTDRAEVSTPERSRKDLWIALLIWALCLLIYNANMRLIAAGDTYPARYLPFGLWRYHTLRLDPIDSIASQGRNIGVPPGHKHPPDEWLWKAYWMVWSVDGHKISIYPVATSVLLAPLYAPAVFYLSLKGWEQWRFDWIARIMEKVSSSLIAATSAALLYLLLRRRAVQRVALLLTFAYALGTTTWMIGSQALWQHGMTELLIVGMLLAVTGPRSPGAVAIAGLLCGLIACNRPPDSILAGAIGLYGLWWAGRKAPLLVGAALAPVLLVMAYNLGIAGHWAGGYGLVGKTAFFAFNPVTGVLGLLFSPARGLFVYSPFLLFTPVFARRIWSERGTRFLTVAMGTAVLLLIATYAKTDWRQGYTWGPRWLTSALPMLVWMLPPVFNTLRWFGRTVFIAACMVAVTLQVIGAFWYTGASEAALYAVQGGQDPMRAAWDPRNSPFLAELRHPAAPRELNTAVQGSLDIATTYDGAPLKFADGKELNLAGWALANGRDPREVMVMLDGQVVASTPDFFTRPDITETLGVPFVSGWRLSVAAHDLDPGDHVLALFVRAVEAGEAFFLADAKFAVPETAASVSAAETTAAMDPQTLSARAQQAAHFIESHQDSQGYWLTEFTKTPSYRHPRQEMNTYFNAMMVDLLTPIAEEAQLEGNLTRARRFLAAQIEDGGLVRYHGRPDSTVIGKLGCAITPDTDDTALVWRIAPAADRGRLGLALATLRDYRKPDGLYRTWLSPRERYECVDPGVDPNPADAGIQMHVFMLLATKDPPAARTLCRALGKLITKDEAWVYYRMAPDIPTLRQADLYNAGCAVELPPSLLNRAADGQQEWIALARFLQPFLRAGATAPRRTEVESLLKTLSRDDFALLRQTPPLLYHNDLTASVPRFYWSESLGYALWLRLYFENERAVARRSKR